MPIMHPVGIEITVEVLWDVPGSYTDITDDVRFLEIQTAQRSRLQNTFDSGRLVMTLDNSDRKYDPMYAPGPYFGKLRPGKFVRVLFDSATATPSKYAITCEIDSFALDMHQSNNDSTMQVTCVDSFARAAHLDVLAGDTPPNLVEGQDVDERMHRVLVAAGAQMNSNATAGEYPSYYVAEFTSEWDNTRRYNALDEIRRLSDLEQGPAIPDYVNPAAVIFHTRHWFQQRPRSATVQAAFGSGGLPVYSLNPLFDANEIVTAASMSDENGNTAQVIDAAAINDYGWRAPFATYDGLPARNIEALRGAVNTIVALRAGEEFRIDQMVIKPGADPEFRRLVPELTLLDRVQVNYQPMRLGDQVVADYFIDGITHSISPGDWTTTYSLWSANRFDDAIPNDLFIIGTTLVGGSESVGL